MMGTTLFIDPGRCIGCQACVAACRECDSHRGKSMIHLDYIDAGRTAAAMPTVCMHCEDPVAPCAEVCPADAILVTADGVVQEAAKERCIGCGNCVDACPFGVPKLDVAEMLQYKCNLCYDRTSVGLAPMCATVCPHRGHLLRLGRGAGGGPAGRPGGRRVPVRGRRGPHRLRGRRP
jgi:Fe-S-cluster-containing dehydrogenase component